MMKVLRLDKDLLFSGFAREIKTLFSLPTYQTQKHPFPFPSTPPDPPVPYAQFILGVTPRTVHARKTKSSCSRLLLNARTVVRNV